MLTHAYNSAVSSVTGFSPYFLMFGRTPKIPLDTEMGGDPSGTEKYVLPELCQETASKIKMDLHGIK